MSNRLSVRSTGLTLLALLTLMCTPRRLEREKIVELVQSKGACDRIKGFIAIGESKDTSLYKLFFENMEDRNIAHCAKYYGKSVLWAKIEALRRITNMDPTNDYDPMNPNLQILEHYRNIMYKIEPAN